MFLGFLDQCYLAFGGLRKEATKRTESAPDRKLGAVTEREEERTIPTYNPMHLPMPSIAQALTHVNTGPSTSSTSASLVHATVVAGAAAKSMIAVRGPEPAPQEGLCDCDRTTRSRIVRNPS